jgi:tetratricopeptide (TPR) repeat protein
MAHALSALARLALDAGDRAEARPLIEKSIALASEVNDLFSNQARLGRLAQLEMDESRFAESLALHERRVESSRLLGERLRAGPALHDLAVAARLVGELDRAREAFDESLALCQSLGQTVEVAFINASLGHLHLQRSAFAQAADMFVRSLRTLRSQDAELGLATALCGVGRMTLAAGQAADAACLVGAAEAVLERLRSGPLGLELNPSQIGPRRYQFHRDSVHLREALAACKHAFDTIGTQAFQVPFEAGRALTTDQAIDAALQEIAQAAVL